MAVRPIAWLKDRPWVCVTVLIFATIGWTHHEDQQTRKDVVGQFCRTLDADHNRERASIIEGQAVIYRVPAFHKLIPNRQAEDKAYSIAKHRYLAVRKTRPPSCYGVQKNPVPPFPTIKQFKTGHLPKSAAQPPAR